MTGILNHPKMPVVAGSLALALLAGGVYSSMEQSNPVAASVKKVDAAAKAAFASSVKAPAPALPQAAASAPQVQLVSPNSALPSAAASEPRHVVQAVEQPRAEAPAPQHALSSTEDVPHEHVTNVVQALSANPVQPAEKLIIQPIMPTTATAVTTATPAPASELTPVTVKPMPVARVTVPDAPATTTVPVQAVTPVQPVTAVQSSVANPVAAAENVHAVAHPVDVATPEPHAAHVTKVAPAAPLKKKKKHHVVQQDDESDDTPVPDKPITVKRENIKADGGSEYTEIKGTATSEILAQPRAAAPAVQAAPAKSDAADSYRPNVVLASGGRAWVKISPERTIVVKAGDNVPGLGKVNAVTGSAIETDKGKFSVNSKE